MDYPENRDSYLREYPKYLIDLVLNTLLIASVMKFSPKLWDKHKKPSEETIKSYILLELTKTRESCDEVIKLLVDSKDPKNAIIAKDLKEFNKSPGRKSFGYEVNIPVTPVSNENKKKSNTRNHAMTKSTRGRAIIINVVPNEVLLEAQRFYHIFKQLFFKSEIHICLTTYQIKELLKSIADDIIYRRTELKDTDEALIVMIITHGQNEQIKGYNHTHIYGSDVNDISTTVDIVDIFADVKDTVKMFFFTCCRNIEDGSNGEPVDIRYPAEMNCAQKDGSDTNKKTIIFYSSAEGYETKHNGLYTAYGKVLSESIAQYAHNETLTEIMNRTNQELEKLYHAAGKEFVGYFAPEYRGKCTTHSLYFNPGWHQDHFGKKGEEGV